MNPGGANLVFDPTRPRLALVTPANQVQLWDWQLRQLVREWTPSEAQGRVSVSRFSADGATLVLTSFHEPTSARRYLEWEIATGRESRTILLPPAEKSTGKMLMHFPGENEFLLIGYGDAESMRYDFSAARFIPTASLHLNQAYRLQFSLDGKLVFAPSAMGEVRVFDSHSWQETAKLRGFMFGAHSVAFAPDGQRLVTGSTAQESITIWDQGNYERLLTFPTTESQFHTTGFSPDGNVIVGRSNSGKIFFWRAPTFEEIAQAEARSGKLEGVAP
jgi:WD40 repeat protein